MNICTCCYDYMLLLILLLKISAIALFTCTTLLFNSLSHSVSLLYVFTVCYSSTTFHCHLLLFHFSKRYRAYVTRCWFLWAFARGVLFFHTSSVTGFIFTFFSQCSNLIHSDFVVFYISSTHSFSISLTISL